MEDHRDGNEGGHVIIVICMFSVPLVVSVNANTPMSLIMERLCVNKNYNIQDWIFWYENWPLSKDDTPEILNMPQNVFVFVRPRSDLAKQIRIADSGYSTEEEENADEVDEEDEVDEVDELNGGEEEE